MGEVLLLGIRCLSAGFPAFSTTEKKIGLATVTPPRSSATGVPDFFDVRRKNKGSVAFRNKSDDARAPCRKSSQRRDQA